MTGIELLPANFPGVSLTEPYPDWRTYRQLSVSLYSDYPEPFELVLRIHDRQHDHTYRDRFNRVLNIKPGANHFRLPLTEITHGPTGRTMQIEQIAGVILFAWNLPQTRQICIDRIQLER